MDKEISFENFTKFVVQNMKLFSPNEEYVAPKLEIKPELEVESLNLRKIPCKSILHVLGKHFSADYRIRVDDINGHRMVNIWRDIHRNGLIGPAEGIFSRDLSKKGICLFEEGTISKGHGIIMPYFEYRDGKVLKPKTAWCDVAQAIFSNSPR